MQKNQNPVGATTERIKDLEIQERNILVEIQTLKRLYKKTNDERKAYNKESENIFDAMNAQSRDRHMLKLGISKIRSSHEVKGLLNLIKERDLSNEKSVWRKKVSSPSPNKNVKGTSSFLGGTRQSPDYG